MESNIDYDFVVFFFTGHGSDHFIDGIDYCPLNRSFVETLLKELPHIQVKMIIWNTCHGYEPQGFVEMRITDSPKVYKERDFLRIIPTTHGWNAASDQFVPHFVQVVKKLDYHDKLTLFTLQRYLNRVDNNGSRQPGSEHTLQYDYKLPKLKKREKVKLQKVNLKGKKEKPGDDDSMIIFTSTS